MNETRWIGLMALLGLPAEKEAFAAIDAAYSETHRHYHTRAHIEHCLREFDAAADLAMNRRKSSSPSGFTTPSTIPIDPTMKSAAPTGLAASWRNIRPIWRAWNECAL